MEGRAPFLRLQPLLPAARIKYGLLKLLQDARGLHARSPRDQCGFLGGKIDKGIELGGGELRPDVGSAHARGRVVLRIRHPICVVPLDERAVGTDDVEQLCCDIGVEIGRVQVGPHLADDETGPGVEQLTFLQPLVQTVEEVREVVHVHEAAVHLFRADLIGDGRQAQSHAFCLGVVDHVQQCAR